MLAETSNFIKNIRVTVASRKSLRRNFPQLKVVRVKLAL